MSSINATIACLPDSEKRALVSNLLKQRAQSARAEAPLSYGQKALWFLHKLAPDSTAYHVGVAMRIRTVVDVSAMHRAVQRLVNRHPMLRTTFIDRDGEPVQVVSGYRDVAFEFVDLDGASEEDLRDAVLRDYQRPFHLEQESVFRAALFRRAMQDWVLLLTVHHIAYDGWSLWLNQNELRDLYAAEAGGEPVTLAPIEKNYFDYIRRQNALLGSPAGERLWTYWREQMSGHLQPLNLPFDHPRPPVQRLVGASYYFTLDSKLTKRLRQRARREDVTPYVLLLAAFAVLLHRYSGQDDILIATPASGHDRGQYSDVVGYFVNQVVIRADLSGNLAFQTLLRQMQKTTLDALAHQDFPFALLVERLQPERDPSYSPVTQVCFVYQKPQRSGGVIDLLVNKETGATANWGGLQVEYYELPQQEGQFDLELEIADAGDRLYGIFKYNTGLFDGESIARMSRHFETLLESILAEPECSTGKLRLLSESERRELTPLPKPSSALAECQSLVSLFEAQAAAMPDALAVTLDNVSLSYGELNARANQLAWWLCSRGVKPDVRVAICLDRSIELIVGILGILKAGGAYVPIDPMTPAERVAFIAQDANAPVLLTTSTRRSCIPHLPNTEIVDLDADWPSIAAGRVENLTSVITADTAAYIIYTSGSTGAPKGCVITQYNVLRLFTSTQHWFHFSARDVWTLFHSYAFDFSVWEIWGALLYGGRLVLVPYQTSRSFDLFYRLLVDEGVTVLNQTPSAFRQLIAAEERDGVSPDLKLRLVIFGGEALEMESLRPWFLRHGDEAPQLVNMYGITETTVHVTYRPLSIADLDRQKSVIGGPIPDLQLYILDRYLEPVPVGVPGELHVGGAGLARGYLNRPELTDARFIRHPFTSGAGSRLYKTGDLVRRLADGDIEYLGRLDHQIKIRGFRVELGEIETALARQSAIRHAAVIARKNRVGETQLVAYVVPAGGESLDFSEIRRNLRTFLPEYMVPGLFVQLDALPLTKNGKIDQASLPDLAGARLDVAQRAIPPSDALQLRLVAIWERVLDVRGIGIRDNFFEAGGHSLAALRLSAELEHEFSVRFPVSALIQNPTIEGLAPLLRNRSVLSWQPAVPIQKGDGEQPLFFVPGGAGNLVYLTSLAPLLGTRQALYGMQYRGLDGEDLPDTRVEIIAGRMIEAMAGIQESGPYFLGGHCFGGLVAFEIARQLCRQGQSVELLAIIDIPAPLGFAVPSIDPGQGYWIEKLAQAWQEATGKPLPLRRVDLEAAAEEAQLELFRRALVSAEFLPSETALKLIRGLVNVFRANSMAHYRSDEMIPVPIALFRAEEFHAQFDYSAADDAISESAPSTLGWARLSTEPVTVHKLPGNHLTMLNEPNIAALGQLLRGYLARAETDVS